MKTLQKMISATVCLFAGLLTISAADGAKGGGQKLLNLSTPAQIEAVAAGDTVVMACPKCKTVMSTRVKATAKGGGSGVEKVASHGCPGCGARIEKTGVGKEAVQTVKHVCTHCKSEDAFCSVLKKNTKAGK